MNMSTTAVRADDGTYRLNGNKAFVTNGPIADLLVVYARTGASGTAMGISTFLIEADTPGLHFGKPMTKMGLKTSPLCEVFLDDVAVPEVNRLGREGAGFLVLDHVMKREILYGFVINVGEMQYRLESAIEQAKSRRQFGAPIGSNQAVQNLVVDMVVGVETSRRWLFDTGEKVAAGAESTVDVAISKLVASQTAVSTAMNAVQIFGGYGYMAEYGFEKDLRNAVAGTIYSGTTEIQKSRIAAMYGL